MPDTATIKRIFAEGNANERTAADARHKDLQDKAQERHDQYLEKVGDIEGDIKVVNSTIIAISKQVTIIDDKQTDHALKLGELATEAKNAKGIGLSAHKKVDGMLKAAAGLPAEPDVDDTQTILQSFIVNGGRPMKQRAKDAAIGGGILGTVVMGLIVLWNIIRWASSSGLFTFPTG